MGVGVLASTAYRILVQGRPSDPTYTVMPAALAALPRLRHLWIARLDALRRTCRVHDRRVDGRAALEHEPLDLAQPLRGGDGAFVRRAATIPAPDLMGVKRTRITVSLDGPESIVRARGRRARSYGAVPTPNRHAICSLQRPREVTHRLARSPRSREGRRVIDRWWRIASLTNSRRTGPHPDVRPPCHGIAAR